MGDKNIENQPLDGRKSMRVAWIPLQAGCLTFSMAVAAILVGFWLDMRLGTAPRWTLILLIGSAPFTLGGVYLIVRRALNRVRDEIEALKLPPDEEAGFDEPSPDDADD